MKVQVVIIVCLAASGLALGNYRKHREDDSSAASSEELDCRDGLDGNDYKATLTHLGNFLGNLQDQPEVLRQWSQSTDEKTDNLWDAMQAVKGMLTEFRDGDVDSIKTSENNQKLFMSYKNMFEPFEAVMEDSRYIENWSCDISKGYSGNRFKQALADFNGADPNNDTDQLKALLNVMAENTRQPGT